MGIKEGLGFNGFIRVKMLDEHGNVLSNKKHNVVVNATKKMALASSMGTSFGLGSLTPYGLQLNLDNQVYRGNTIVGENILYQPPKYAPAIYVLNLGSQSFNASSKFLPIVNAGGLDQTKVTGFATNRRSSGNVKEGIIDFLDAEDMAGFYDVMNAYTFDVDKANGDFTHIAIAPNMEQVPYRANTTFKGISKYFLNDAGTVVTTKSIGPGVYDTKGNVVTTDEEILMFYTSGGSSRWKYNIVTGETTAVQPGDFAFTWPITGFLANPNDGGQHVVVGDFLYLINGSKLYRIEIATGAVISDSNMAHNSSVGGTYGLWFNGTNIVTSSWYDGKDSSYTNRSYVRTWNPNTLAQVSTTNNNVYTGWGGLPTFWQKNRISHMKVGDRWYVRYHGDVGDGGAYAPSINNGGCTLICSDIMDVMGSLIGITTDALDGIFEVSGNYYYVRKVYDTTVNGMLSARMYPDDTTASIAYGAYGTYLSNDEYTNFWSIATNADTKTSAQKMYISYGYNFQ